MVASGWVKAGGHTVVSSKASPCITSNFNLTTSFLDIFEAFFSRNIDFIGMPEI
jgi:hypothetical protein